MAIVNILDAQGVVVGRLIGARLSVVDSSTSTPSSGAAVSMATYAGTGQSGLTAGGLVPIPPAVRVTDLAGNPVAGSTVTWFHGGGSGTTSTGTVTTTNSNGVSQVGSWSLGTTAGSTYTLFAYSGNLTNSPIGFSYVPGAASAFSITASGGTSQTTTPTGVMPSRLSALVHDAYGNPVSGATVTVTTSDADAVLGASTLTTNSNGVAGTTLTVGQTASVQSVWFALSSATSARYAATIIPGPPDPPIIVSGDGQTAQVSTTLPNAVQVLVQDAYANTITSGETLQFVVVQGSGTISLATATPNASGSSFTWAVGATAGQNAVEISLANRSNSTVTVFASGTNPTADTIRVAGGTGQSATVAQAVTLPLRWGVLGSGSSASGQIVDLTITGDGSLSTTRTVSSTSGFVNVVATAGTVASRYTVTASAGTLTGSPSSITFDAVAASAASLFIVVQPESNPQPGVAWNTQPVVYSGDSYGNPVSTNTRIGAVLVSGDGTLASSVSMFAVASGATATFSGLSYTQTAQSAFQIAFRCNSLSTVTATAQTAQPPFASKLGFTAQPVSAPTGQTLGTITVAVQDSAGNTVAGATNQVTLAIGTNPGGGTLSGTTTVNAVNGVATFTGLSINAVGTGYTLTATATNLTGATSATFDVTAASGIHPNEPAGFTQITVRPWDSATENGWSSPTGGTLRTDGVGLPKSGPNYIRHSVPTNSTGVSLGTTEKVISSLGKTRLYAHVWFRLSDGFQGHSTGTNKLGLWLPAGSAGNSFFVNLKGTGTGNLLLEAYFQGVPTALNGGSTSRRITKSTGLNQQVVTRGVWHHFEIDYTLNTYDVANGVFKMWFNGVLFINETDIGVRGTGGEANQPFWRIKWNPIWGGTGTANTSTTQIECDEIYVSG